MKKKKKKNNTSSFLGRLPVFPNQPKDPQTAGVSEPNTMGLVHEVPQKVACKGAASQWKYPAE
jgi:hypothetical protein